MLFYQPATKYSIGEAIDIFPSRLSGIHRLISPFQKGFRGTCAVVEHRNTDRCPNMRFCVIKMHLLIHDRNHARTNQSNSFTALWIVQEEDKLIATKSRYRV